MRLRMLLVVGVLAVWGCCDCQEKTCGSGTEVKSGDGQSTPDSSSPVPDGGPLDGRGAKPDGPRPLLDLTSDPGAPAPDAPAPDVAATDGSTSDVEGLDLSLVDLAGELPPDLAGTEVAGEAGPEVPEVQWMVATAPDWLNMRDGPGTSFAVVRAIPCGGEVVLDGLPDGNWTPVLFEGTSGWVSGSHLVAPALFDPSLCPGPKAYAGEVPGNLVTALDVPPYVEQSCKPATFDGWPFDALKCTYNGGLKVTVANPSPELVALWIVDAAQLIPALWAQKTKDPNEWKKGLKVFASHVLYQSSRIFPLAGQVDEGTIYTFDKGVTAGCSTGCYCRINSLMRQQWCAYAAELLGIQKKSDCLALYSTTQFTDAWADHCLDNHRAAWTMPLNHHFRAMAYWANEEIAWNFPDPANADGATVVSMLNDLLF